VEGLTITALKPGKATIVVKATTQLIGGTTGNSYEERIYETKKIVVTVK
jgi:hypothetical protein